MVGFIFAIIFISIIVTVITTYWIYGVYALVAWIAIELIFLLLHLRPLNDRQIVRLSGKRRRKFIRKNYSFSINHAYVDPMFKSSMNPNGKLYSVNLPLCSFPAYTSLLLKGKKHEWVVIALEGDTTVKYFWANKGLDKSSVSFSCSVEELVSICKTNGCHTLMRFHNHPNSDPNNQTCFLASTQDVISAKSLADYINLHGLNWIDFVCERGRYLKYYESYSKMFVPTMASVDTINALNGKSKFGNYKLHRELGLFFRF